MEKYGGLTLNIILQEYTNGKLKVCVYHNADPKVKKLSQADLRKFDVIMISCESTSLMMGDERKLLRGAC